MFERAAKNKSRKEKTGNWVRIAKTQTGGARPQTRAASDEKRHPPMGRHASRSEGLPPANPHRQRENTPGHRKTKSQQLKPTASSRKNLSPFAQNFSSCSTLKTLAMSAERT